MIFKITNLLQNVDVSYHTLNIISFLGMATTWCVKHPDLNLVHFMSSTDIFGAWLMEHIDPNIFIVAASVALLNIAKVYVMLFRKDKKKK